MPYALGVRMPAAASSWRAVERLECPNPPLFPLMIPNEFGIAESSDQESSSIYDALTCLQPASRRGLYRDGRRGELFGRKGRAWCATVSSAPFRLKGTSHGHVHIPPPVSTAPLSPAFLRQRAVRHCLGTTHLPTRASRKCSNANIAAISTPAPIPSIAQCAGSELKRGAPSRRRRRILPL